MKKLELDVCNRNKEFKLPVFEKTQNKRGTLDYDVT